MSEIVKLTVGYDRGQLFGEGERYIVPMYQRYFAWGDQEIKTLLDDIDKSGGDEYYLGSLVVAKKSDSRNQIYYEIVDGQQRLTALFLVFCTLELLRADGDKSEFLDRALDILNYECRDKTKKSFAAIINGESQSKKENSVQAAAVLLREYFEAKDETDVARFKLKLNNVRIFRVEIPKGTNLNLYYERMNTRSEQLEQADILKARLMREVSRVNNNYSSAFAVIWKACSNMDEFVQMNFGTTDRKILFGDNWDTLNLNNIDKFVAKSQQNNDSENDDLSLDEIIGGKEQANNDWDNSSGEKIGENNYESIISFPSFLIHAGKIYKNSKYKDLCNEVEVARTDPRDLNDLQLVKIFNELGIINEGDAFEFVKCLLCLRFLFDKYIIKRKLSLTGKAVDNGEWVLHSVRAGKENSPYYLNSYNFNTGLNKNANRVCIMIQSCLRVAYTAPRSMHWITTLLNFIYKKYLEKDYSVDSQSGYQILCLSEIVAAKAVEEEFPCVMLADNKENEVDYYSWGVKTPHIVFHFLDYLLWKYPPSTLSSDLRNDFEKFEFKFRNSVEHWLPQTMDSTAIYEWSAHDHDLILNDFGNLAIVTTNTNAALQNEIPTQKIFHLRMHKSSNDSQLTLLQESSLKLRLMIQLTEDGGWLPEKCIKHRIDMISFLNSCIQGIKRINKSLKLISW